ncbi:uncharacterized protein DUF1194 [Rhodovulum imhoffii]|uniref:Uncharacterized protein DUF1194 n=2 Tax=Rhodovulum imhoffii TaxID=365340 RepID=A0A2T5BWA5_9RHOB|nr:uncharacterized protein DUF1194 [Rhodovulum imhoffii]
MRLLSLMALLPAPAEAACRLALLLALDVSSSVDGREDALQRAGLARALTTPRVERAFLAVPGTPVALSVYEWSGRYQQHTILDWTLVDSPAALRAAAAKVAHSSRRAEDFPTAMGYAIGHAAQIFDRAPDCLFRTLDISGDGITNDGFPPALAYAHFPLENTTVNGLAIGVGENGAALLGYFQDQVIKGPGAFVEQARDYNDFANAMQRKLLRELVPPVLGWIGDRAIP